MSEDKNNNETKNDKNKAVILEDEWLIRPSTFYEEEYSDCTSIRARFHQYFIFGKYLDCTQWRKDADNCYKWEENKDIKAATQIIESEKQRRRERLGPHYQNNVWQRRKTPPENWNSPLPEHIQKEYEYTYLNLKNKEMKGESPPTMDLSDRCTIM